MVKLSAYKTAHYKHGVALKYAVCLIVDLVGLFPIIVLPRIIIDNGWLGLPLAFSVLIIQVYTAILLGHCWIMAEYIEKDIVQKRRYPYAALAELAYGRRMSVYVTLILDLSIFGACIPDLLIISQTLQIIGLKLSRFQLNFSYCYWMIIIGVIISPIMWLGSPKDMKFLGVASAGTVLLTSILTWFAIMNVNPKDIEIPSPSWESVAIAYGILSFQFDVHGTILSLQMDMENKYELGQAVLIAFLVSGGLFCSTAVLCYFTLGSGVEYNTLQGLPSSPALWLALSLTTLQLCFSMAFGTSPLFQDLEESLHIKPDFSWKRCWIRTLVVLSGVAIGELVPRFDLVMGLIGAALVGQLIFIFPPLIYGRLRTISSSSSSFLRKSSHNFPANYGSTRVSATVLGGPRNDLSLEDYIGLDPTKTPSSPSPLWDFVYMEIKPGPETPLQKCFHYLLVGLGILATIVSTYFAIKNSMAYADFGISCFSNTTLASFAITRNL